MYQQNNRLNYTKISNLFLKARLTCKDKVTGEASAEFQA